MGTTGMACCSPPPTLISNGVCQTPYELKHMSNQYISNWMLIEAENADFF